MNIIEINDSIEEAQAKEIQSVFSHAFNEETSEEFLERANEKRHLLVLLAIESSQVIGFKIGYEKYRGIFFSWLGGVLPDHRRKGVARCLMQHQHKLCKSQGYNEIRTETAGNNEAMLLLNIKEGFEVYGSGLGHGEKLSVYLRKFLGD